MAIPASGPLTLANIQTEFGGVNPIGLNEYYAGGAYVTAGTSGTYGAVPSSGAISIRNFYGTSSVTVLTVNSTVTNYNIFTSAGSPTTALNVILNITSSGVIGGVGTTALIVGQFPTGSTITINNSGIIRGFGGVAGTSTTGGNGGDALNANQPNQTVVINNLAGAFIQGGGGGGGKGGTGGGGSFTTTTYLGQGNPSGGCGSSCTDQYGAGAYCGGACGPYGKNTLCYDCVRNNAPTNTNGGAGGNGGIGQGYAQANVNGSAGAAGGTNAGTGGTGGNGAVYGTNGATGATGANGNRTNGVAGSAGGTAGRYLVKGANSVTLNNSGTVAGGLA